MKIDKSALRQSMLTNKLWLGELYQSPNKSVTKKVLASGSEYQLKTLVKILHMIRLSTLDSFGFGLSLCVHFFDIGWTLL